MKTFLACLLIAMVTITMMAPLEASASSCYKSKIIEHDFDADDFNAVQLKALAGDLEVSDSGDSAIHFHGKVCTTDQEHLDMIDLVVSETDGLLYLEAVIPWHQNSFDPGYATMDIELSLPADLPISLRDSSGDMEIEGVSVEKIEDSSGDIRVLDGQSDLVVRDSSGEVYVSNLNGSVRLSDSSGDLVLRRISADVNIPGDSSGSIDIRDVEGSVQIDSDGSGDIEIDGVAKNVFIGSDGSGDIEIENVGGKVTVQADGSGEVIVADVGGSLDVFNKGAGTVKATKIKGDVNIPR